MSDCDRFTRLLLAKGHGFPLFLPSPPVDLPDAVKRNGTQIGDVGIVCNDGSFDPIFNIYRPEGDLANRFGVPSDFKQLPCGQDDILQVPRHPAGTVILNSPASAGAPVLEQALLRLPDGASTRDSRSLPLLRDYAAKHARSWYQFVNDDLERMVGDSGLYLVTGVTKTTSWSIDVGSFAHVAGGEWDEASATINSGPHRSPGEESRENQSVFIRGFKVALRPSGSTDTEDEELSLHSIYHPSDIINKYKFDADPSAMVAVTHDDEWTSVLGEADIKLPDDEDLIARISKKFKTSNSGSTGSWVTPQPFVRGRDLWIHAPARRAVSR
ncbi:hypothetical protein B0H16DRAFT_115002 [Mycena metata]|uniref:Uncharacterized protein n=1 Tax=Mycena metata TaxID=1033252 RepID=A0AAD7JXH8_9AGAR|nr:hypothetical protein B0H16DRAFT_115002 [Mycena metata]